MEYYLDKLRAPVISTRIFSIPMPFDRSRTLFNLEHIKALMPIGTPTQTKTFSEICDARALFILKKAREKDQPVKVLWSGGIDSTVALVALIKQAAPEELLVVYSDESVAEYPLFFSDFIHEKVPSLDMFSVDKSMYDILQLNKGGIVCTGEIGDQIFGSMVYFVPEIFPNIQKNWKDVIKNINSKAIPNLERFTDACPTPVVTTKEFLWWYAYAVKYQTVCLRYIYSTPEAILEENVFHFFHDNDFNDWAVTVPAEEKFFSDTPSNYKQIAKDYIYEYTKDREYWRHKLKVDSGVRRKDLCLGKDVTRVTVDWVRE